MKTLLLMLCSLFILSSHSARSEVLDDSCKTQELLSTFAPKELLGITAEEIIDGRKNWFQKEFGGCRFVIDNPSANFSTFYALVKSNSATVFSKEIGKLGISNRREQIQSVEEGINALKETLGVCGCTKL